MNQKNGKSKNEQEIKKERDRKKDPGAAAELASIGTAGLASGLILAFFAVGGYYLDSKLGWEPVLTIIGISLGIVGSFYSLIRAVTRKKKNGEE